MKRRLIVTAEEKITQRCRKFCQHVRDLKAFLRLRDHHPALNEAKSVGAVGIPCFVLEDGTVTLNPEDAGLRSRPINEGATCNIDGSGC